MSDLNIYLIYILNLMNILLGQKQHWAHKSWGTKPNRITIYNGQYQIRDIQKKEKTKRQIFKPEVVGAVHTRTISKGSNRTFEIN